MMRTAVPGPTCVVRQPAGGDFFQHPRVGDWSLATTA